MVVHEHTDNSKPLHKTSSNKTGPSVFIFLFGNFGECQQTKIVSKRHPNVVRNEEGGKKKKVKSITFIFILPFLHIIIRGSFRLFLSPLHNTLHHVLCD